MAMRVEFKVNDYGLANSRVVSALHEVFGHRASKYARCCQPLTIECGADQFVRFLVARDAAGATNGFKNLDVKILEPKMAGAREVFP